MNLRVAVTCEDKLLSSASAVKASLKRANEYVEADAEASERHWARRKSREHGMEVRTRER